MLDQVTAEEMPATVYHAVDAESHSRIKVFRHSRPLYHATFVAKTEPQREPTEPMEFGTLIHAGVLEPEKLESLVAIIPDDVLSSSGSRAGAKWKAWSEENAGLIQIKPGDFDKVQRLVDAVHANPTAERLLTMVGKVEHSLFWDCQESGVACKCRADKLCHDHDLILDLKTCQDASPRAFANTIADLGYHRQAGFYTYGYERTYSRKAAFAFIAVSKNPPHEVAVYDLSDDDIAVGRGQCIHALQQIKECRRTGDWSAPYSRQVTRLDLPVWAKCGIDAYELL